MAQVPASMITHRIVRSDGVASRVEIDEHLRMQLGLGRSRSVRPPSGVKLTPEERLSRYRRQNGNESITPRQRRRLEQKSRGTVTIARN
jgi:hypothetical protein